MQKPKISKTALDDLMSIRSQYIDERRRFVDYWKQYAAKVNPIMSDWDDTVPGQKAPPSKRDNFDNTGQKASDIFANGMQSAAFGRAVPWIATSPEDLKLKESKEVAEWLQRADRAIATELNRTSFYEEGRAFTRCAADFGTGIMFRDFNEARALPIYHSQHLKRCLIDEDEFGEVDTLIRDFWLTSFEAASKFGRDTLPDTIIRDLDDKSTRKSKYIQFIFPKDKYHLDYQARNDGKTFYSLYATETDGITAIAEGGYSTRPFYVWRWSRSLEGDVWGVDSPGMIEYSNMLQADSMKKDFARLVQLAARPPIKATEGMQAQGVHLEPNYKHFLRPGEDFAPVPVSGNLDGMAAELQDIRKSIRESYYSDFFLTLTANLERVKTATEATYIKGEQAAMLVAMSGRMTVEFLEPAIEDIFGLLLSYGRLPPMPESLKGQRVRVDLQSPLAQLQKRYMMLNETDEFMARILQVAQIDQKIMDKVDLDAYADTIAEAYNQDRRVVRDLVDVENIRNARNKAQSTATAQQLQNETTKAQATMLAAGDRAPEAGSPVESMMKGGQG